MCWGLLNTIESFISFDPLRMAVRAILFFLLLLLLNLSKVDLVKLTPKSSSDCPRNGESLQE